jgi:hypothetical protein
MLEKYIKFIKIYIIWLIQTLYFEKDLIHFINYDSINFMI